MSISSRKLNGRPTRFTNSLIDTHLQIATLTALRQVGDSSFTQIVTTLASGTEPVVSRVGPEVVIAASECLPYLEQRKQDIVASNELVRPSRANSVGSADILVRPVVGTLEVHEAELLRAAED